MFGTSALNSILSTSKFILPELKAIKSVDQYALLAEKNSFYPVMIRGFKEPQAGVWLNAGDVWKYGTTMNPSTRYTGTFLRNTGNSLRYDRMMSGTLPQALSAEKIAILHYRQMFGRLPPGNKMVK